MSRRCHFDLCRGLGRAQHQAQRREEEGLQPVSVGRAFHPVWVGVDGLVLICEGCFLHMRPVLLAGVEPVLTQQPAPLSLPPAASPGHPLCGLGSHCVLRDPNSPLGASSYPQIKRG